MATRLEPPAREDNGLWSLAAACGVFRDSRRNEQHSPMLPSIDAQFHGETSDHESLLNSSSPHSGSNLSSGTRLSESPEFATNVDRCGSVRFYSDMSKCCDIDHQNLVKPTIPSNWATPASSCPSTSQSYDSFTYCSPTLPTHRETSIAPKCAPVMADLTTSKPNNFLQSSRASLFPLLSTLNPKSENCESITNPGRPQEHALKEGNSKHSDFGRKVQSACRNKLSKPTSKEDLTGTCPSSNTFKTDTAQLQSSADSCTRKANKTKRNHKNSEKKSLPQNTQTTSSTNTRSSETQNATATSSTFDAADAAQALLGLSEGFLTMSKSTTSSRVFAKENPREFVLLHPTACAEGTRTTTSPVISPLNLPPPLQQLTKCVLDFGKEETCAGPHTEENGGMRIAITEVASPKDPSKSVPESPTADQSRFHFKKVICRKFAESLDRPCDENLPKTCTGTPPDEVLTSDAISQNGRLITSAGTSETALRPKQRERNRNQATQDNKKQKNKEQHVVETTLKTSEKSKLLNSVAELEKRESTQKVGGTKTKTFADVIKTKHNKTSYSSKRDNNANDQHSNLYRVSCSVGSSTESLNKSCDESDEAEESDSTSVYTSESEDEEEETQSDQEDKEKTNLQLTSGNGDIQKRKHFTLSEAKFSLPTRNTTETKAVFAGVLQRKFGISSASRGNFSLPDPTPSSVCTSAPFNLTPDKSKSGFGSVRIKKATFTFSTRTENNNQHKFPQMGGDAQSRTSALGKCPLTFRGARSSSENGEGRSWNANDDLTTFGALADGASFKTLSCERSHKTQHRESWSEASNSRIAYDKRRLPRPNARSPALEAPQAAKSKSGQKRRNNDKKADKKHTTKDTRGQNILEFDNFGSFEQRGHHTTGPYREELSRISKKSRKDKPATACRIASYQQESSSVTDSTDTMTSRASSRQSSLAGDDEVIAKKSKKRNRDVERAEKRSRKRHRKRHHSANPLCRQEDESSRINSVTPRQTPGFQLLSCFPAPASLTAGLAKGELVPSYGATAHHRCPRLPAQWQKGSDVVELKQKKQRERWKSMTLDMFCMGSL
ncbi:LOW QUALITY PROTEIN: uncharacterized protein LOC100182299 [Ciona intestinalis]